MIVLKLNYTHESEFYGGEINMKYTVITGASSGIGYETALAFAARGKNLILVARRLDKLEELKSTIRK